MALRYNELGERLRAFRLGSGKSADEMARELNISRTAFYRLETGELVKLETLEKLSKLLKASVPTLLGVGTEYIPTAVTYFERLRQIESRAVRIVALAGPFSFLLSSEQFLPTLEQVLRESIDEESVLDRATALDQVTKIVGILEERKRNYAERQPNIVNLISVPDIERFLRNGLTGRAHLPEELRRERRRIAREEAERLASIMEEERMGVQVALFTLSLPRFHIYREPEQIMLTLSPFRLSEQPNIWVGVASITSAPEALLLHENEAAEMWRRALKGADAAKYLRGLIKQTSGEDSEATIRPINLAKHSLKGQ